jgi:iron(II)-dependent oxidoreductase
LKQRSAEELARRKRYLHATLITCIALVMIGSSLHVVKLGAGRMEEMRKLSSYDLKEEQQRIRAAGEDITLHETHEAGQAANQGYVAGELDHLLTREQWVDYASMVNVPGGSFEMGTDLDRADAQDKPTHTVTIKAFVLDKFLVANALYARFVAATGHRPPLNWKNGHIPDGANRLPVTMVTWFDARAYCSWAGKRLPTEAEFERAGRGSDGRRWPWGDKMDPKLLNTYYTVGAATPVDAYPKGVSPYGAYDLAGNVAEWLEDDFLPYAGSAASADLFQGKVAVSGGAENRALKISDLKNVNTRYKVVRGGSWNSDPFSTALYHRNFSFANHASDFYGFRCASDAAPGSRP